MCKIKNPSRKTHPTTLFLTSRVLRGWDLCLEHMINCVALFHKFQLLSVLRLFFNLHYPINCYFLIEGFHMIPWQKPPIQEIASQTCFLKYLLFRKNTYEKVYFLRKASRKRCAALLKMTSFIGLVLASASHKQIKFSKYFHFYERCNLGPPSIYHEFIV